MRPASVQSGAPGKRGIDYGAPGGKGQRRPVGPAFRPVSRAQYLMRGSRIPSEERIGRSATALEHAEVTLLHAGTRYITSGYQKLVTK